MPNNIVKSFAKKTGKSVEEVEKEWDESKKIADESDVKKDSDRYYGLITTILKNKLGLNENRNLKMKFNNLANEILTEGFMSKPIEMSGNTYRILGNIPPYFGKPKIDINEKYGILNVSGTTREGHKWFLSITDEDDTTSVKSLDHMSGRGDVNITADNKRSYISTSLGHPTNSKEADDFIKFWETVKDLQNIDLAKV